MDRLDGELAAWGVDAEAHEIARPDLDELWRFCAGRANVSPRTRVFIETWRELLGAEGYASGRALAASGAAGGRA